MSVQQKIVILLDLICHSQVPSVCDLHHAHRALWTQDPHPLIQESK